MQIAGLVIALNFIFINVISPSTADLDDCFTQLEGMSHTIINTVEPSYATFN